MAMNTLKPMMQFTTTFATIAQDVNFHMGRKQLHAFLSTTFNFSSRHVNIMLTKNDIHTLADVVITDPT
jgi:hypothetical protein